MEPAKPTIRRCVISTRKSSEGPGGGLQPLRDYREACEALIRSQAAEGWHPGYFGVFGG